MSEPVKITSVEKAKDPRRVEAGKKLGAISRQAKERKGDREEQASEAKRASEASDIPCVELSSLAAVFVAAVVVGGIVLHYKTSSSKSQDKSRDLSPSKGVSRDREDREEDSKNKSPAPKRELDTLGFFFSINEF